MYWLYLFVGATDCFVLAIKTSEYNVIDKMLISILNVFCYIEVSMVFLTNRHYSNNPLLPEGALKVLYRTVSHIG